MREREGEGRRHERKGRAPAQVLSLALLWVLFWRLLRCYLKRISGRHLWRLLGRYFFGAGGTWSIMQDPVAKISIGSSPMRNLDMSRSWMAMSCWGEGVG